MTFLIPYVLFVILIGSTGVIEEMALGRATKGGPIKAFGDCMPVSYTHLIIKDTSASKQSTSFLYQVWEG